MVPNLPHTSLPDERRLKPIWSQRRDSAHHHNHTINRLGPAQSTFGQRGRQGTRRILPLSTTRERQGPGVVVSPVSPNVPFVAWRLRLSKGAVFSPRPSCGVSQNRDRRTSPQLSLSARGVARVPRKPFPRTPDRSGMSQSYHCPLDAHIVWRRP